jgi:hypothetical protein
MCRLQRTTTFLSSDPALIAAKFGEAVQKTIACRERILIKKEWVAPLSAAATGRHNRADRALGDFGGWNATASEVLPARLRFPQK